MVYVGPLDYVSSVKKTLQKIKKNSAGKRLCKK